MVNAGALDDAWPVPARLGTSSDSSICAHMQNFP